MMVFAEILLETLAAIGEAIALPIIKPTTASQYLPPNIVKKVKELKVAIKKSADFYRP